MNEIAEILKLGIASLIVIMIIIWELSYIIDMERKKEMFKQYNKDKEYKKFMQSQEMQIAK
jgi:hypothetical protein